MLIQEGTICNHLVLPEKDKP